MRKLSMILGIAMLVALAIPLCTTTALADGDADDAAVALGLENVAVAELAIVDEFDNAITSNQTMNSSTLMYTPPDAYAIIKCNDVNGWKFEVSGETREGNPCGHMHDVNESIYLREQFEVRYNGNNYETLNGGDSLDDNFGTGEDATTPKLLASSIKASSEKKHLYMRQEIVEGVDYCDAAGDYYIKLNFVLTPN